MLFCRETPAVQHRPLNCWSDFLLFHTLATCMIQAPPPKFYRLLSRNVWKWIMEISDGKLAALVFHLPCSYPVAALQPTRDRAGNITLSSREAHGGASPSQGTSWSIYLPVAWACLIQALSEVDLSPLPGAVGLQTQYRPPFFLFKWLSMATSSNSPQPLKLETSLLYDCSNFRIN